MRTILPDAEHKAKQAMQDIASWLNRLYLEDSNEHGELSNQITNTKTVIAMLDAYRNEVHDCDITIARLTIENSKLLKIKKIVND
jgi:hypothetical protein